MADWTDIVDAAIDPDAPLTSDLAYAWRDNPVAIAEGAVDAPKIAQRITTGSATGSAGLTFTGLGAYGGLTADIYLAPGSPGNLQIQLSDDGTIFYGTTTIRAVTASHASSFSLNFSDGVWRIVGDEGAVVFASTGTVTGSSLAVVAIRFLQPGDIAVMLEPNGGIVAP